MVTVIEDAVEQGVEVAGFSLYFVLWCGDISVYACEVVKKLSMLIGGYRSAGALLACFRYSALVCATVCHNRSVVTANC